MASTPFAVIAAGGRQYKVAKGDRVRVDRMNLDEGAKVTFDDVRLVSKKEGVAIGTPRVEGAKVSGTVVEETRDRKVIVFKRKRRKGYRRTRGHRQWYTLVEIEKIEPGR